MTLNVLQQVFVYNQHFVAMMNIINSARLNTPTKGHRHHIVPRCWFRMNNLPIDNSNDNLVLLSYEDHVKVHKLSMLCAATHELKSKMGFAVKYMLKGNFSGMHHTIETRRKMSEARKGHCCSDETRRKMSEANKGRTATDETRRKLSESLKGRTLSGETRRKMSEARKGNHLSEETRKKISEANKVQPRSEEYKIKMSEARKGKTWKVINGKRVWLSNGGLHECT